MPSTVSITDYGADPSGQRDSTAAIQAAIDDQTDGRLAAQVTIPPGNYVLSAPIRLRSRLHLLGMGNPVLRLKDNAAPIPYSLLVAVPGSNGQKVSALHLEGFTLDGNREHNIDHGVPDQQGNQSPFWQGALLALLNLTGASDVRIYRLGLRNSWGSGVWIVNCTDVVIADCLIQDYRFVGISIRKHSDVAGTASRITVRDNRCSGGAEGIQLSFGVEHIAISGNVCYDNRDAKRFTLGYTGTYPAVYPKDSKHTWILAGAEGYESPALEGDGAGIEMTGVYTDPQHTKPTPNQSVTVTGNICFDNQVGIRVEQDTRHISIVSNSCSHNDKDGIFIFSSRFCAISGNQCYSNRANGIRIEKELDKGTQLARPEQIAVTGNVCTENYFYGISLVGAWQCVMTGNTCSGNNLDPTKTGGGIALLTRQDESLPVEYCTITGNTLISYFQGDMFGVFADNGARGNIVVGNVFLGFSSQPHNLDLAHNVVENNMIRA